jgi:hypothetical protein
LAAIPIAGLGVVRPSKVHFLDLLGGKLAREVVLREGCGRRK